MNKQDTEKVIASFLMLEFEKKKELISRVAEYKNVSCFDVVNALRVKFENGDLENCIWDLYDVCNREGDSFKITMIAGILNIIDKNKDTSFVLDTFAGDSLDLDVYCMLWYVIYDYSKDLFEVFKLEFSVLIKGMSEFLFPATDK